MGAVQSFNGFAELALVKAARSGILGIDAVVAFPLHAKTVDVVVLAQM